MTFQQPATYFRDWGNLHLTFEKILPMHLNWVDLQFSTAGRVSHCACKLQREAKTIKFEIEEIVERTHEARLDN